MGLHLGSSKKLKFIFTDKFYDLYIPLIVPSFPSSKKTLKSLDNFMLKDLNGLYLTSKEE